MMLVWSSAWWLASCLVLVVACDHRPPSKQVPAQPGSAQPGSAQPVAAPADAGVPNDGLKIVIRPDAGPIDEACVAIGVKLSDIIIAATTDPTQRAAYEQERTKLVKRFSENCQREGWPEATRACFMAAKSPAEVELCSRDLAKAPAPAAAPGSAAPKPDPHAGHVH